MGAIAEDSSIWNELPYDEAWADFEVRFGFQPDYHERTRPAIDLPPDSLVIDLRPIYGYPGPRFAAGEASINASALRCFVWLLNDLSLTALDWQHPSYEYSPASHVLSLLSHMPVPVFPNGDYYIHASEGLRWGTFGHPWQQTLTIWGHELIATLGAELLTWLPRHAQSRF